MLPPLSQHVVCPVAGNAWLLQPLTSKPQPGVQASVPPPVKPSDAHVAPPRSVPSHSSGPSFTPFPHAGTVEVTQRRVLMVQAAVQRSVPPSGKPSEAHVAPPKLVPSHSSPGSMTPLPQYAVQAAVPFRLHCLSTLCLHAFVRSP